MNEATKYKCRKAWRNLTSKHSEIMDFDCFEDFQEAVINCGKKIEHDPNCYKISRRTDSEAFCEENIKVVEIQSADDLANCIYPSY